MWMKLIGKDLEEYKISRCEAETIAQDRASWSNLISQRMSDLDLVRFIDLIQCSFHLHFKGTLQGNTVHTYNKIITVNGAKTSNKTCNKISYTIVFCS